jgi:Tfp pilus assembly protein PilV
MNSKRIHRPSTKRPCLGQSARGVSLIEALIAFLLVSVGLLGLLRTQESLRLGSEASRHRGEALRLAQQTLEEQRGFASLAPAAGVRDYRSVANGRRSADSDSGFQTNTHYEVKNHVVNDAHQALKSSHLQVRWTDRQGQAQSLDLHSLLAGQDPALAAALSQAPRTAGVWGTGGRSPWIPQRAKDLGDGRSALKPLVGGSVVWVFDNHSGRITATCTEVPSSLLHDAIGKEHLDHCSASSGLLLSGLVRFSLATPPAPEAANDLPLTLNMTLRLSHAPSAIPPLCVSQAVKEVGLLKESRTLFEWVPLDATPSSLGLEGWSETGERFVSYDCLVDTPASDAPGAGASWSGRSEVAASSWVIGTNASQYRICRYSSDTDGSGAVDRNEEHPAIYHKVHTPLNQQHFLVVRGELLCPKKPAVKVDGVGEQVYVDGSTLQHQP